MVSWGLSGVGHHSQATIHVNSFTLPSGNFDLALRKFENKYPTPTPTFPQPPVSQGFLIISHIYPGVFRLGLGKVRKFLPGSAGRATHVDTQDPGAPPRPATSRAHQLLATAHISPPAWLCQERRASPI